MFEQYLAGMAPSSAWWPLAYERYTATAQALGTTPKKKEELAKPKVKQWRTVSTVTTAGGVELGLADPASEALEALGKADATLPVADGSTLNLLDFAKQGVSVLMGRDVLAIILNKPNSPRVSLRRPGLGTAPAEIYIGMPKKDLEALLGDEWVSELAAVVDPNAPHHVYQSAGLAVKFVDGKVAEIIVAAASQGYKRSIVVVGEAIAPCVSSQQRTCFTLSHGRKLHVVMPESVETRYARRRGSRGHVRNIARGPRQHPQSDEDQQLEKLLTGSEIFFKKIYNDKAERWEYKIAWEQNGETSVITMYVVDFAKTNDGKRIAIAYGYAQVIGVPQGQDLPPAVIKGVVSVNGGMLTGNVSAEGSGVFVNTGVIMKDLSSDALWLYLWDMHDAAAGARRKSSINSWPAEALRPAGGSFDFWPRFRAPARFTSGPAPITRATASPAFCCRVEANERPAASAPPLCAGRPASSLHWAKAAWAAAPLVAWPSAAT